jgi:diguanylate cyclase (GGDEF)-like protein/PAS domain S-box-containing protein
MGTEAPVPPRRPAPKLRTQIALGIIGYALVLLVGLGVITALFANLSLRELATLLLIAVAEAIAIAALAGAVLSRKVAHPMEAWAEVADRIGEGARDVTFPAVRGSAELERLGATLQTMLAHLAHREGALRAAVEERGAALEQATAALQMDRDRLAHALEGSRLTLWELDVVTGVVRLSAEWARLMGLPPGETTTTLDALRSLVPEEERPELTDAIWAVIKGERDLYDVDHRVRRSDGSTIWIRSRGKVTSRDASGRAVAMIGTNSEIGRRKAAEAAARESEARLRLVVDNIPLMINLLDRDFRFIFANRPYLEFFGLEHASVTGRTLAEVAGEEAQAIAASFRTELKAGRTVMHERERRDAQGNVRHFEIRLVPHWNVQGEFVGYFSLIDDVTERRAAARALAESEAELRLVTDGVASLICRFDLDGRILYANRRYHEFYGIPAGGAIGKLIREVAGFDAHAKYREHVGDLREGKSVRYDRESVVRGETFQLEVQLVPHRNAEGTVDSAYVLVNDITARKLVERLLEQQALSDPLTGLPNKRHFAERMAQALAQARRRDSRVALLFLDLDGFKDVNDRLGHAAGDNLLKEVAARLGACVRAADTIARIGGDEFAVLLESNRSPDDAEFVAGKLVDALRAPFPLAEGEVRISCSVGVALFPADGEDFKTLLGHADMAMYRAKQAGKGRVARWTA